MRDWSGSEVPQLCGQLPVTLDDPFRVIEIERDSVGRIADEMAARPLTGGRRVVRVRDVTDAAAPAVQAALASRGEGLVVLEAGELAGRSKLRAIVEAAVDAASITCYAEQGRDLERTIAGCSRAAGLSVSSDAASYLADHLGNDRAVTRQEFEKLALYVQPGTAVDLAAAISAVGDMAGLQLDDAVFATTTGDMATSDRALELALSEGASPIGALRILLGHLQRLERVVVSVQGGESVAVAIQGLRPPLHFRRNAALTRAANLWRYEALAMVCRRVSEAELACKTTGLPAVTLCRNIFATIARGAATQQFG